MNKALDGMSRALFDYELQPFLPNRPGPNHTTNFSW